MGNKRIKVKPTRGQAGLGFVMGIAFCIIGVTVVIPQTGMFGVIWTLGAAFITFTHFKNAFSEEGMAVKEIIVEEDCYVQDNTVEQRLETLESLYQKRLITQEEYETKRQEIMKDL